MLPIGEGLTGESYALPTKDDRLNTLPLSELDTGIARFLATAAAHPDLEFRVTPIGCGLAAYIRIGLDNRSQSNFRRDAPEFL